MAEHPQKLWPPDASTDEMNAETDYAYTPVGLTAQVTAAAHDASSGRSVVTTTYNGRGQVLTSAVSGVATPTVSSYDIFGEVTQTVDPKGNPTNYTYYPTGQRHTTMYANHTVATQVADNVGNLTSVTQPTGPGGATTVGYTYSVLNQVRTETDPADAQHTVSYAYDRAGRQTDRYDLYAGVTQTTQETAYDADGRPVTQTATSLSAPTFSSVTTYDAAGAVTAATTTLNGVSKSSVTNTLAPSGQLVATSESIAPPTGTPVTKAGSFTYNNDGSLASRTFDAKTTYYGYQLNGEVTATTGWTGGSFTASYFPNGALATQGLPNGANLAQTYDTTSRLASKTLTAPGGATLSSWSGIVYDANSNVSQSVVSQAFPAGTTPASYTGTASWTYDALNRMRSYRGPLDPSATAYSLDDAGNVTGATGPSGATSSAYQANRITQSTVSGTTTTFGYDDVGNQTTATTGSTVTTTTYDAANHPLKVANSSSGAWVAYTYDGMARLASRSDSTGAVTLCFHDGLSNQAVMDYDATPTKTVLYVLDPGGTPLAQQVSGTVSYFVTSPRSDVAQLLDASGNPVATFGYDAFGNPNVSQTAAAAGVSTNLGFQMGRKDAMTGQYNLGPRLYNPQIERFVGADLYAASAASLATQVDPLTGNRYLYAGANPAGMIDNGYQSTNPFGANYCPLGTNPDGSCRGAHKVQAALKDAGNTAVAVKNQIYDNDPDHQGFVQVMGAAPKNATHEAQHAGATALKTVVPEPRLPDYYTGNVGAGIELPDVPVVQGGANVHITVDRYGGVYLGIGPQVGASPGIYTFSIEVGWLDQRGVPSAAQLRAFLTGGSCGVTGAAGLAVGETFGGSRGEATETGLGSPQVGGGCSGSLYIGQLPGT